MDIEKRKQVIDEILSKREKWKFLRYRIDTGNRHPDDRPEKPRTVTGTSEAEILRELNATRVNISKYKKKLIENPDSKKFYQWQDELERLEAIKEEAERELVRLRNSD